MGVELSVENLRKVYPGQPATTAVDGISFVLKEREILGLLGPNGSGKTTTIQMLLGTLSSTSGSIRYFGKEFYSHRSEILQKVSFASTYTNLPWVLTVEENLKVYGALYGFGSNECVRRFDPLLKRFGIYEKKGHRVGSLSAGQITRLMLVKAFFIGPKIVLLDEPTASLDPEISNDICSFLMEEREKSGLSILFTSHKMEEVIKICDRAIFLKEGKIIADDLPEKLAKSSGQFKVKLILNEGMAEAEQFVRSRPHGCTLEGKEMVATMDEEEIPKFLQSIGKEGISYASIKIDEPSLEDYFLHISKRAK